MAKNSTTMTIDQMPEAFVSNVAISRAVSRAVKAGRLRKLASRLYTRNLADAPEVIISRNIWSIVAGYFPGALIADRTALENAPAEDGSICLITDAGVNINLPGHILRPRRGAARQPTDKEFVFGLYLNSTARAYLENMRPSRARGGLVGRTLPREKIEKRLDDIVRLQGDDAANRLRDAIRGMGKMLDMEKEAAELDNLIGSLLGTRKTKLTAPAAIARQGGHPYDPDRMEMFQILHSALRDHPPQSCAAPSRSPGQNATLAFFEAYFSNFIEGTEFLVSEAANIVFDGIIPTERPQDAHDILGTWRIVFDDHEISRTPIDYDSLIQLLQSRHAIIMESRPDINPGAFKMERNQAGPTVFVDPELVAGTLDHGFAICRSLESPFQRAVFMMFLIAEVHPFVDGNGRIARMMMNAELVAAGEERIIIPTIYRANYLSALKALSQSRLPQPVIRMLDYAQRWTAGVHWQSVEETQRALEDCNAFLDSAVADREGKRLMMAGEIS